MTENSLPVLSELRWKLSKAVFFSTFFILLHIHDKCALKHLWKSPLQAIITLEHLCSCLEYRFTVSFFFLLKKKWNLWSTFRSCTTALVFPNNQRSCMLLSLVAIWNFLKQTFFFFFFLLFYNFEMIFNFDFTNNISLLAKYYKTSSVVRIFLVSNEICKKKKNSNWKMQAAWSNFLLQLNYANIFNWWIFTTDS